MTDQQHDPDTLADALDQALPSGSAQIPAENSDPLVAAAIWMASAPRPNLPSQAKADLQARLIAYSKQQQIDRKTLRPNFQPLLRWAVAASIVLIIMATGIPATLASVPGDILYPAKQMLEQFETRVAGSPSAQASLKITHAERRFQEAEALLNRGQVDSVLIMASLDQMAAAAQIIRTEPNFPLQTASELEKRAVKLNTTLSNLLVDAGQMEESIQTSIYPLMTAISATQDSGALLLPETITPVSTETPTKPVTSTPTNTSTHTATPAPTDDQTITPTPEINLFIEGPVQSIDGNIITIYGITIEIDVNNPLLEVIKIGDNLLVAGNVAALANDSVTASTIETEIIDSTTGNDENGPGIWLDNGNCDNPPPDWAPANGWRARCEGQSQLPGGNNSAPPGQQNNPGQGQNRNSGKGSNKKSK